MGHKLHQPQIQQLDRAFRGDHDIARLQIAVQNAAAVRFFKRAGDLDREPDRLLRAEPPRELRPFDEFHHQVIPPDVVKLADVRVIERRDRTGFLLEARRVLAVEPLDRHRAVEPGIARFPHLAHSTRADECEDFVGAKCVPQGKSHASALFSLSRLPSGLRPNSWLVDRSIKECISR